MAATNSFNASKLYYQLLRFGYRQKMDTTHKKIRQMLNCNENGILMDRMKMSLKCPITKTQMKVPVRSKTCSHLQCFDLGNYLKLNEKKSTWKCPICNGNAHYDYLIIDEYILYMLKSAEIDDKNADEVELLQHGGFRVRRVSKSKEKIITIDDDSNDGFDRHARNRNIHEASGSKSKTCGKHEEVVTINDSNDEIQSRARKNNAIPPIRIVNVSATVTVYPINEKRSSTRVTRKPARRDLCETCVETNRMLNILSL